MGENWAGIASEVAQGIAEVGQTASLVRSVMSGVSYDPTVTQTLYAVTIAVMAYKNSEIDGTLIQRGDKMAYLASSGLAIEPDVSDKIIIGGVEHSIIEVMPLAPAGPIVFWQLQIRK